MQTAKQRRTSTGTAANAHRRSLYAKTSIACKVLDIDDDTFRDLMAQRYGGRRSRTELSIGELENLVEHFVSQGFKSKKAVGNKAGTSKLADSLHAKKIRALWLSLYHLGVVRDPSEVALMAFSNRVNAGIVPLQWLDEAQARKVIEALKKWAERSANVDWSGYPDYSNQLTIENPRCRVIEAQIRIVKRSSLYWSGIIDGLMGEASCVLGSKDIAAQDHIIRELGSRIRREQEIQTR